LWRRSIVPLGARLLVCVAIVAKPCACALSLAPTSRKELPPTLFVQAR
tara:strand:+ start:89 stop:232 length:144 start_codon:yes stop_codon:yes gene_type:complete